MECFYLPTTILSCTRGSACAQKNASLSLSLSLAAKKDPVYGSFLPLLTVASRERERDRGTFGTKEKKTSSDLRLAPMEVTRGAEESRLEKEVKKKISSVPKQKRP